MSDERSLFDSFERLVNARLDQMQKLALTAMTRNATLEARVVKLEKAHTPVEATPVESERERNGRLFWEANSAELFDATWPTLFPTIAALWCDRADLFIKAAGLVPLAQVEAVPDYTALKELLGHPGFSEDSFIDGYNRACRDVRRWIDGQEAHHE